jgi:putative ABC transport system permease protein
MPIAMPTRWTWREQLAQDVRFGARALRRNPGFAATAVLTLALGLGATTAIFSILNGVLLRPLPFAEPERLVQLYGRAWREERAAAPDPLDGPLAAAELDEYARQSTSFEGFASYGLSTRHLSSGGEPERLTAVVADSTVFTLLGVAAILGRTFRPGDPADVVVISARLWRRRFDADPALPGRTVTLDGRTFTVLGVMGDRFQFPYGAASALPGALPESRTDLWVPREPTTPRRGRAHAIARLKPGVAIGAAGAELRVIAERLERQQENPRFRVGVRVVPLREVVLPAPVRRSLWMLFAAVGLVLAAACATVANLLLTRTALRAREVATRAALGAGRARLVRQLLAESLLLALAGAAAGAVVARWGTSLLVALGAAKIPRAHEIALDWRAFGFLFAVCLTTALLAGLAPAAAAARVDVQGVLRAAGGGASAGRGYGAVRDALVVTEVALAFVLSLGAALVIREVVRLRRVESGMVTAGVVTLHLTPRAPAAEYYAIEDRVRQLPGVRAAGFTQLVPLQPWGWEGDFAIRGRPAPADERLVTGLRYVTPGYFDALGIPVVRGRALGAQDVEGAPRAVVVNEALARRYFPGEDPVGRELDRGTIVGVVGDVRQVRLDRPAEPELYYPAAQNVAMTSDIGMTLVVRAAAG